MYRHEQGHGYFIDSLSGSETLCILDIIDGCLSCHSETEYRNLLILSIAGAAFRAGLQPQASA
jgi:hypothetical protein